jgi:hypothetical protein
LPFGRVKALAKRMGDWREGVRSKGRRVGEAVVPRSLGGPIGEAPLALLFD